MSRQEQVREANAKIAELIKEAEAKLNEAARIADQVQVDFYFEGMGYGMGGTYHPTKEGVSRDDWVNSEYDYDDEWYESGWQSSSSSC